MPSLFPHQKRVCISNCLKSIQFQLDVLWFGGGVEIRCVESTCFEVFQNPFLIFMLGSAYRGENVILVVSLLCFSSVANTLQDGMRSTCPWHVWEFLVFILSPRFTERIWIALWRSCSLNLGSMVSQPVQVVYMWFVFYKIILKPTYKSVPYGLKEHNMLMLTG